MRGNPDSSGGPTSTYTPVRASSLRWRASPKSERGTTIPQPLQLDFSMVRRPSGSPAGRKMLME
jgi:hypothetical protein